jgi:hypothetical protein
MPRKASFVLFILLVACGSAASPPSTTATTTTATTTVEQAESLVCEHLQVVRDMANEMSLMSPVGNTAPIEGAELDEAALIAEMHAVALFLDEKTPEMLAAYEAAAVAAGNTPDLAADIRQVADLTAGLNPMLVEAMSNMTSLSDFSPMEAMVSDNPAIMQQAISATGAILRIDEFTIPICGFKLSS